MVEAGVGIYSEKKKAGRLLHHNRISCFFVTISKVYHYSEKSEFCASCHEMKIHYDSFKASKHHNEHVENCHACHVGPGAQGICPCKAQRWNT